MVSPLQDLPNTKTHSCHFILFHIQRSGMETSLGWFCIPGYLQSHCEQAVVVSHSASLALI